MHYCRDEWNQAQSWQQIKAGCENRKDDQPVLIDEGASDPCHSDKDQETNQVHPKGWIHPGISVWGANYYSAHNLLAFRSLVNRDELTTKIP